MGVLLFAMPTLESDFDYEYAATIQHPPSDRPTVCHRSTLLATRLSSIWQTDVEWMWLMNSVSHLQMVCCLNEF